MTIIFHRVLVRCTVSVALCQLCWTSAYIPSLTQWRNGLIFRNTVRFYWSEPETLTLIFLICFDENTSNATMEFPHLLHQTETLVQAENLHCNVEGIKFWCHSKNLSAAGRLLPPSSVRWSSNSCLLWPSVDSTKAWMTLRRSILFCIWRELTHSRWVAGLSLDWGRWALRHSLYLWSFHVKM